MTVKRRIKFGQINLQGCSSRIEPKGILRYYFNTEPYSTRGRVRLEVKNGAIIAANIKEKSIQPRACIRSYLPSWQMDDFINY